MTDKEIETLRDLICDKMELISIETSEKYLKIIKEYTTTQISLHSAQCEAKKLNAFKGGVMAFIGAGIAILIEWLKSKLSE